MLNKIKDGWSRLTIFAQVAIIAIVVGGGLYLTYPLLKPYAGLLTRVQGQASQEVVGIKVPKGALATTVEAAPTLKPVYTPAQVREENVGQWRHLGIPWNAQIGLISANGGSDTARGSLMAKYGLNTNLARQDMYDVMQAEQVKFATAFAAGEQDPATGVHSVIIMGDGAPGYLAGLQPMLDKLGLHAVIIGAPGRSFGEDKVLGPPEWADDSKSALGLQTVIIDGKEEKVGGAVGGVARDGDLHILFQWAQLNGLKVNPDDKTWDPDAINLWYTGSFADADNNLIQNQCQMRPVVKNGKMTGAKQKVCALATATWTPGDVNVVQTKGGVVSLLSTRETGLQMFATIIVIKEWAHKNPATVTNFLKAALDGSATVARDRSQLRQAACFSAKVWGEQDCAYWEQNYYGHVETVKGTNGRQVRLGGSQALGLASNLEYFLPQGGSVYETSIYPTFGDLDRKFYPAVMPSYPSNVVDTSFLEKIRDSVGVVGKGDIFKKFTGDENQQVANRAYSINFAVGSATILSSSNADLQQILNNVTVSSNLAIEVNGYASTDGDSDANLRLSEARAQAVRQWLVAHASKGVIAPERVRVTGYGATNLLCESVSEDCHRQNRRVEIRLLGAGE